MPISTLLLAQMNNPAQGWLTQKLLGVTLTSAEWVLWLLVVLSVLSIAVMLERAIYFWVHRLDNYEQVAAKLSKGEYEAARSLVGDRKGMEAAVVREALAAVPQGVHSVEEVIAAMVAHERPSYERFLSYLGTLGSNAPFVGLFGTVLGIIKAFHDLGQVGAKGAQVQQTVMAGISEALVATAVGLAVAIPAVVAYNAFTRNLKTLTARTTALGHALIAHMKVEEDPGVRPLPKAASEVR